jgi:NAD(P)-dependent dehydrogenase (short-subunit alcohol dehydrogenase family)
MTSPRTVLITGGSSGLGLATAKRFAAAGDRVIITGRDQRALDAAVPAIGVGTTAVRADASDPAALDALYASVAKSHGAIDVLFVNAGIVVFAPAHQFTPEMFDTVIATNLRGAFFTATKAFAHLRDGAAVILNGSGLSCKGMAGASVYSLTKAGLVSLARTLAAEWAPRRIRVNVVSPGPADTPIHGKMGLPPEALAGMAQAIAAKVPLGRFGEPAEIADAVFFTAGNTYMTGSELFIDGGFSQI